MTTPRRWIVAGVIATVIVAAAVSADPAIALAAIITIGLLIWACFRPSQAATLLAFLTAAFPKAGVKIGSFPFPIFLFGLLLAVLLIGLKRPRRTASPFTTVVVAGYLVLVVAKSLVFTGSGISNVAAFAAWAAIPVVILFYGSGLKDASVKFRRAFEWGFLVAVAYGLVQLAGGINATAIPGLSYAYGDNLLLKYNDISIDGVADYSKIPSTYQNGNIFGLVAACFFAMALLRIFESRAARLDFAMVPAAAIAIALSGSRTAVIAAVLSFVVVFLRQGAVGKKILVLALMSIVIAVVLTLQPGLADRYTLGNITASGGAGRTSIWAGVLATLRWQDFIFGTYSYQVTEGWLGFILQIGLVGIAFLVATVLLLVRGKRDLYLPALILSVGAVFDSSYLFFPTWFIFAAMSASLARTDHSLGATQSERKSTLPLDKVGAESTPGSEEIQPRGFGLERTRQ